LSPNVNTRFPIFSKNIPRNFFRGIIFILQASKSQSSGLLRTASPLPRWLLRR